MKWEYATHGVDGNVELFGVNIFKYPWSSTGERVAILDQLYQQEHIFSVFTTEISNKLYTFAAGEFSNCIWGFYLQAY